MSFVEGLNTVSFDLADPTIMLYVCVLLIFVCVLLDAPAIVNALRFLRLRRRLAKVSTARNAGDRLSR